MIDEYNFHCLKCKHYNLRVKYNHDCWWCGALVEFLTKEDFKHMWT